MADILQDAQAAYREAMDALRDQRLQIEQDLAFSDPSQPEQWETLQKIQREQDPGGMRPCLVHDQTGQYVSNVTGQFEKSPPSLHAIPVGGGADKKAAEQIDGRFRHIEYASRAAQHYGTALTSAARTGVGYLIIKPEFVDRALNWQEPRIGSEGYALNIVLDPWSKELDGSDINFGYQLVTVSQKEFERRWPKKEARSFGDDESTKNDERKSIILAECWTKETKRRNVIVYTGADGQKASGSEDEYHKASQAAGMQLEYHSNYSDKYECVRWRLMSGADVLEKVVDANTKEERDFPSDFIGIVPVYGYVGFKDGRLSYCGIPRRARSPQQAYNYHISELMMPSQQLMVPMRAIGNPSIKEVWDRAKAERRAYLPYTDHDENGPVTPPSYMRSEAGLVDHVAAAEKALQDIQASIGMYQANLGSQGNETSGVAIESRKQQGEASTAHFPSHASASIGHVGQIVMQMDMRLSDTQRAQPTIGVDGSAGSVNFDPMQPSAFERTRDGISVNPSIGRYGIRVVVGASYSTQRTQTNQAFAEVMRNNKEMAAVVAPFWAQTLDFPGSDKFAQALAAMAPDPVKAILQPEGQDNGPDPAQQAQQIKQMGEALQEAIQHAKEAQQELDEKDAELREAKHMAETKESEVEVKRYEAETNRLKVTGAGNAEQAQAIVKDLINQMMQHPDPLPGEPDNEQSEGMPAEQGEPAGGEAMQGETTEGMEAQPAEPTAPSPELQALMQGQAMLTEAMGQLIDITKRPRVRTAHRDKQGNLTHTTESIGE